jgi:hypothetical protein
MFFEKENRLSGLPMKKTVYTQAEPWYTVPYLAIPQTLREGEAE